MKKTIIFLILLILVVSLTIFVESGGYMDFVTIGQGDNRWCRLTGCTIVDLVVDSLTVYNLSVIGDIFNVTMIRVNWTITDSFNVGGNLVAENITANGNFIGDGSLITGITASNIEDIWVNESGDTMTGNLITSANITITNNQSIKVGDVSIGSSNLDDNGWGTTEYTISNIGQNAFMEDTSRSSLLLQFLNSTNIRFWTTEGILGAWHIKMDMDTDNTIFYDDVSFLGNVSIDNLIGNGSQLTSLNHSLQDAYDDQPLSGGIKLVGITEEVYWNTSAGGFYIVLSKPSAMGINSFNVVDEEFNDIFVISKLGSSVGSTRGTIASQNWTPLEDNKYNFGCDDCGAGGAPLRWKDGYFAGTVFGANTLSMEALTGNVLFGNQNFNVTNNGSVVTSKNVTAKYFIGNGTEFTNLDAEDININLPTSCPTDNYQYGFGNNMSTILCRVDKTVNNTGFVNITELRVRNITSPYVNRSNIFFQTDGSIGITLDPIIQTVSAQEELSLQSSETKGITWSDDCQTKKENGVSNIILGRTEWVKDIDAKCKGIKEAKSLKGYYFIQYLRNDGIHDFEIVDLNYTSIKLNVFVKDSKELNKDIPFKVDDIEKETKKLTSLGEKLTVTFTSDNVLASNYTFGTKSTTIQLKEPDSDVLEDTEVNEANPTGNGGSSQFYFFRDQSSAYKRAYIKFNISIIPSEQQIDNSLLSFHAADESGDPNISIHHVYNQSWIETYPTWNNQFCGTAFDNSDNCNLVAEDFFIVTTTGRYVWNVTTAVQTDYSSGNKNVSFVGKVSNEVGANKFIQVMSKERTTVSQRPYLNITYTAVPSVSSTLVSPSDGSTDIDGDIIFNCSATATDSNLVNISLYHNISGVWGVNETQGVSGTSAYANFTMNDTLNGEYIWNCLASNDEGNTDFSDANWSLTVSIPIPPKIPKFFIQNMSGIKQWWVNSIGDMWLRNDLNISNDLYINSLTNCDTINTTAEGKLICGDDSTGEGLDSAYNEGENVIDVDTDDVVWNLTSTQDFIVQDNGINTFIVNDTGDAYFRGDVYMEDSTNNQFLASDTSGGAPAYSFASATRYGMAIVGTNLYMIIDGNGEIILNNNGVQIRNSGSSSNPALKHTADGNSGMYWPADDTLGFSAGAVEMIKLIETSQDILVFNEDGLNVDLRIETDTEEYMFFIDGTLNFINISGGYGSTGVTIYDDGNISMNGGLIVDGNVGIGTATPTSKLHVAGTMNITGANGTFEQDVTIKGTLYGGSDVKIAGINITNNAFSLEENRNSSSRFTLQNINSGENASTSISAINDVGGSMLIGIGSSKFMIGTKNYRNVTSLISRSRGDMVFANFFNEVFVWLVNPSDDNDADNLVEIMRVNEDGLNLSTGSIYLGDFQTSAAGGAKVVKRSNANGALFGISNPIAGANPTSGAGYVTIQDCGNYTVDAHSSLDTNNPNGVVHHLRGCLVTEDWRLNPANSSSSFEWEKGIEEPLFKINKSHTNVFNNFTVGTSTTPMNITMFTNPSGNPACCGVMDDMSWGCTAGVCS